MQRNINKIFLVYPNETKLTLKTPEGSKVLSKAIPQGFQVILIVFKNSRSKLHYFYNTKIILVSTHKLKPFWISPPQGLVSHTTRPFETQPKLFKNIFMKKRSFLALQVTHFFLPNNLSYTHFSSKLRLSNTHKIFTQLWT